MNNPICDHLHIGKWRYVLCTLLALILTIIACVMPMDNLPLWNGEIPAHRNQYELMAENILEGRIHFDYNDQADLLKLENPYDPAERDAKKVYYHWDHAFYNGQYYMYFGVVPVFLAFLPYRVLTGAALTTYRATQFFTAWTIMGLFVLFYMLRKHLFAKMPYGVYLALSVAFSVMSVWYASAEPALYCTAITAGLALEVWSLYFFIRGVYVEKKENRQILFAGIGALLGALVFGCRPTIALANLLVLPMLWVFLRQRKFSLKLFGKLALAALPYVLVGAGLMLYNYVRFDDPFEFGQKYQLTVADQSQYSVVVDKATLLRIFNETVSNFFAISPVKSAFPYLVPSSVFFNFPILLMGIGVFQAPSLHYLRKTKLLPLLAGIFVAVVAITAMEIVWTPYLLERYRMDIYFLMGIGCFTALGAWYQACSRKQSKLLSGALVLLSAWTVITAFLLYNYRVGVYYPDLVYPS